MFPELGLGIIETPILRILSNQGSLQIRRMREKGRTPPNLSPKGLKH